MSFPLNFLPWVVSGLMGLSLVAMQAIGGGGRPMFPLVVCYLPLIGAAVMAIPSSLLTRPHRLPGLACLVSAIVLGGYLVTRSCFGGDPGQRTFELLRIASIFLVYLVTVLAVTARGPRLLVVTILVASASLQALAEIYQFHIDKSWLPLGELFGVNSDSDVTLAGTYASKNHVSWLMGDGALLALALAAWGGLRWPGRSGLAYLFLLLCYGVLISGSRGGMLGLVVGLIALAVLSFWRLVSDRNSKTTVMGFLAAIILGGIFLLLWNRLSSLPVLTTIFRGLWMDTFREDLWRASIHDLAQAPFLGLGPASFQWSARLVMPWDSLLAHDDYLQLLSEYGLVGASLLVVMLLIHIGDGVRGIFTRTDHHHTPMSRALLLGSAAVVSAQAAHSAFDFNMHLAANALPVGFFLGVLGSCRALHHDESPKWPLRGTGVIGLLLLTLLVGGLVLRTWSDERLFFQMELRIQEAMRRGGSLDSGEFSPALNRLLIRSADNDRYADLAATLMMAKMAGDTRKYPENADDIQLLRHLHGIAEKVPGDWYLWTTLSRAEGLRSEEVTSRNDYLKAMTGLPLYAYPHQEEALVLEHLDDPLGALHLHRIGLRLQDPRDTKTRIQRLEQELRVTGP